MQTNSSDNTSGNASALLPESLQSLNNVQVNDDRVITAGILTHEQFALIADAGIRCIINLMPYSEKNTVCHNEAELVKEHGMEYIYIPVNWLNPKLEDLEQFFEAMKAHQDAKILVHCWINYRASAFYYLYLLAQTPNNPPVIMQEIMKPWGDLSQAFKEHPQWQVFIDAAMNHC